MTLRVKISVPLDGGPYEAHVTVGAMNYYLQPGDSMESYVYKGQEIHVVEVPQGTGAQVAAEAMAKAAAPTAAPLDNSVPNRDNPFTEGEPPEGAITGAKQNEPAAEADPKLGGSKKSGKA